jgi:SNF2 family DNA or RNA helicase
LIRAEIHGGGRPTVVLERTGSSGLGAWARLQEALSRGVVGGTASRLEIRADTFLAELEAVREARNLFGEQIEFGPDLISQLQSLSQDRRAREALIQGQSPITAAQVESWLSEAAFRRTLKEFQMENLVRLMQLPHGADFSVPGAGKTTVALANFAINRVRGLVDRLLVVAPIAAFSAWKEDSEECLTPPPVIAVHTGPGSIIREDADLLLTNYNRVAADYDRIREYVAEKPTQVVLDEAHRIKRGEQGVHGRAVLDLAYAARRRDVLTGTPAPQGAFDLIAPIRFLYPGQDRQILPASAYFERDGRDEDVVAETARAIERYFVRTPKRRLNLPPTQPDWIVEDMGPVQKAIYDALVSRYRGEFQLELRDRRMFDRLGRITMYLLEAATNPMLLTAGADPDDQLGFVHPPLELTGNEPLTQLLQRYREHEVPWKYRKIVELVAESAERGEKVIIWSTFVRNLKLLAHYLESFQPAVVHGGVPPMDGAPPGVVTREAELDRFRHEQNCQVLLANPAACGEGISLHHWCHHAIYLDRTFNAGHFLQSQDRIHRLGLADGTVTRFTYLISRGTIDELVDDRLREKVIALSELVGDPELVSVALPEPDTDAVEPPVTLDDLDALQAVFEAGD